MLNASKVQARTVQKPTAQLFSGSLREYLKSAVDWDERLSKPFSMALTDDVKKGKVSQKDYDDLQKLFTDKVSAMVREEILEVREQFGPSENSELNLNFVDFGIGEGGFLGIARDAIDAGYNYLATDFSRAACNIGAAKLKEIFQDNYNFTNPKGPKVRFGILQQIFGDASPHQQKFSVGLFSRILQHNPDSLETVIPFIPQRTQQGGRAIIVTPFTNHNEEVKHAHFLKMDQQQFLDSLNSRLPKGHYWDIVRSEKFSVGSELYTYLSVRQV